MSYYYPGAFMVLPPDTVYFITITVIDWVDVFTREEYKEIIAESLDFCRRKKGLCIYAWVLMTNHLHLIASHNEDNEHLAKVIGDFKKFTAKKVIQSIIENPKESRKRWLLEHFLEENINENRDASCSRSKTNSDKYVKVADRAPVVSSEVSEGLQPSPSVVPSIVPAGLHPAGSVGVHYHLWQRGYDSYCIYNIKHLRQKMDYLHANPVRAGIVDNPMHYRYCSYPNYCGEQGLFEIDIMNLGISDPTRPPKWWE